MPPAALDRSAFDALFSRVSRWPSSGDWGRVARDAIDHLVEHPKTGMLMVLVPAGKFLVYTGSGPRVEAELPAFYLGVHPVTNADYARFVAETGHRPPNSHDWKAPEKINHPVVCVNWNDATTFCHWAGLRLPTELEWEKGARGLDGRAYPWGNAWNPGRCRNYKNQGGETTADVWSYGQGGSPFGGLHFSGNVWEWCADRYDDGDHHRNRKGSLATHSSGDYRVLRGGSWCTDGASFFSTVRSRQTPELQDDYFGFRCASRLMGSP